MTVRRTFKDQNIRIVSTLDFDNIARSAETVHEVSVHARKGGSRRVVVTSISTSSSMLYEEVDLNYVLPWVFDVRPKKMRRNRSKAIRRGRLTHVPSEGALPRGDSFQIETLVSDLETLATISEAVHSHDVRLVR